MSTAVKAIASRVARAGIEGLYGSLGTTGGSGDSQKKLDVVAVRVHALACLLLRTDAGAGLAGRMGAARAHTATHIELSGCNQPVRFVTHQLPITPSQNDIMKAQLAACGSVGVVASEEEPDAIELGSGRYVVVFDPLDGSRNIDAAIPTGAGTTVKVKQGRQ